VRFRGTASFRSSASQSEVIPFLFVLLSLLPILPVKRDGVLFEGVRLSDSHQNLFHFLPKKLE
jgi:hypothetical protein